MKEQLQAEVQRVTKLASIAQHAVSTVAFMGGSTAAGIARRDALLAKLRAACIALADGSEADQAQSLADLQAEAE